MIIDGGTVRRPSRCLAFAKSLRLGSRTKRLGGRKFRGGPAERQYPARVSCTRRPEYGVLFCPQTFDDNMKKNLLVTNLTALSCCVPVSGAVDARAQERCGKTGSDERSIQIEYAVCKDIPEQLICLGIGCSTGAFELISIRSGSGAFTGSVQLSTSGKKFELMFSEEDPRIMEVAGASGSRAKISPEVVNAILNSRRVSIRGLNPNGISETYSTKGMRRLLQDPEGECAALRH
jgi:hypothetical protein